MKKFENSEKIEKIFGVQRIGAAFVLDGLPSSEQNRYAQENLTRSCGAAEDVREVLKISLRPLRSLRLKILCGRGLPSAGSSVCVSGSKRNYVRFANSVTAFHFINQSVKIRLIRKIRVRTAPLTTNEERGAPLLPTAYCLLPHPILHPYLLLVELFQVRGHVRNGMFNQRVHNKRVQIRDEQGVLLRQAPQGVVAVAPMPG